MSIRSWCSHTHVTLLLLPVPKSHLQAGAGWGGRSGGEGVNVRGAGEALGVSGGSGG